MFETRAIEARAGDCVERRVTYPIPYSDVVADELPQAMRGQWRSECKAHKAPSLYGLERFEDLEPAMKEALLNAGQRKTFQPGHTIFEPGTIHTHTHIILQGLVRVYYTARSGREVTLCCWADGDLAGGPDFFGDSIHVWGGMALRLTHTVAIRGEDLKALAVRMPKIALWIAHVAMFKLKCISLLFQLHGTESVSQRLPHLLVMLSEIYGVKEEGSGLPHEAMPGIRLASGRYWPASGLAEA